MRRSLMRYQGVARAFGLLGLLPIMAACSDADDASDGVSSPRASLTPSTPGQPAAPRPGVTTPGVTPPAATPPATPALPVAGSASNPGAPPGTATPTPTVPTPPAVTPPSGMTPPVDAMPAEDGCPGALLQVAVDAPVQYQATTAGLTDRYSSYCGRGSGGGPDGVVAVEALQAGTLRLLLQPQQPGFDAVLYAQASCGDRAKSFGCTDAGPDEAETLSLAVDAGQLVYAVIDGRDGTSGAFTLSAELLPAACGDGVLNAGEACDRGDVVTGDGCNDQCQLEPPDDNSDQCPGEGVTLALGQPMTLTGHTVGYADQHRSSCRSLAGGADRVFAVNVAAEGELSITLDAEFDAVLSVFERCQAPAFPGLGANLLDAELLCSDKDEDGNRESLGLSVSVSKRYFVLVDGFAPGQAGAFTLQLSLE